MPIDPNDLSKSRLEGLWTIEFGSSVGVFGGGVAVFRNGEVLGGDGGYFYLGRYDIHGQTLHAEVGISPFIEGYESLFHTVGRDFTLVIEGSLVDGTHAVAQGFAKEMPSLRLALKLTKRG